MDKPPHILLVTCDQLRHDFVQGGAIPSLRTPHLARLAAAGTTLSQAFSSCPLCVPTRFTWLYGLRASQGNGAWGGGDPCWPTHLRSAAHVLQGAGYHTALVGKLHSHGGLPSPRHDLGHSAAETRARGFHHVTEMSGKSLVKWFDCAYTRHLAERGLLDTYRERLERLGAGHTEPLPFAAADSMDGVIGQHARDWLAGYGGEQPFFLHASFCGPHFPYDPVPEYAERYRPEDMPPPLGVDDPEQVARCQRVRARYCALIEQVDDEIGRLLAVLARKGLDQHTVVVFGSDHGDLMGYRGRLGKSQPWDGSARTPITVRFPGRVPAGRVLEGPVESLDLPASLLVAAGITTPTAEALPGSPARSWWDYACGSAPAPREQAFSEMGPWKMVADARWKFVHRADGADELYDRTADPHELRNLATEPGLRERREQLQRRLIAALGHNVAPPSRHFAPTA